MPGMAILLFLAAIPSAIAQTAGFGAGTSVVILRSPQILLAAVDSKETYHEYLSDGTERVIERMQCKVAKIGSYYAIVANVTRGSNGFDALHELGTLYRSGDSIDALAGRAMAAFPGRLESLLTLIRSASPTVFATNYRDQPATEIALLGVSERRPEARIVVFVTTERASTVVVTPRVVPCPATCKTYGYALGTTEKVIEAFRSHPAIFNRPTQERLESLIQLEYADRPDVVGGPLSILKVTPSGVTQVRDGACAPELE